jgi:hypothetical protein
LQASLQEIASELSARSTPPSFTALSARITALESQLSTLTTTLTASSIAIRADVDSSLLVTERKAKSLDELYREANAENEALYERFNEELGRVLKGVKGGTGVEEIRKKMGEAVEEGARLKRENVRLKRENLGLRAQLRGD